MNFRIAINSETTPEAILDFIENHWKSGHAFIKEPLLFDWQHLDAKTQSYNFVTARESMTGLLQGILGYIPMSHYDSKLSNREIFLAIWKSVEIAGLGMAILKNLLKNSDFNFVGAIGLSAEVIPIYQKVLKFQVGKLKHWVLLNPCVSTYQLASVPRHLMQQRQTQTKVSTELSGKELKELDLAAFEADIDALFAIYTPQKNTNFLRVRYCQHKWYTYKLFGFFHNNSLQGLVVTRLCEVKNKGRALRIVDFAGNESEFAKAQAFLQDLCQHHKAEYIDLLALGLSFDEMLNAGFVSVQDTEYLMIPNYFEPLVRENTAIDYAFKAKEGCRVRLFKGDSDQDRPNQF